MGRIVAVPRESIALKPPHGAPCTRCGACCYAVKCDLGTHVFEARSGPCPAIMTRADQPGQIICGLTAIGSENFRAAAALLIGAGVGCDARFNGEPINHEFYKTADKWTAENAEAIQNAKRLWGIEQAGTQESPK